MISAINPVQRKENPFIGKTEPKNEAVKPEKNIPLFTPQKQEEQKPVSPEKIPAEQDKLLKQMSQIQAFCE